MFISCSWPSDNLKQLFINFGVFSGRTALWHQWAIYLQRQIEKLSSLFWVDCPRCQMSVLDFSNNENELSSSLQDEKHAYSSPFIRSNAEPSRLGAGRAGCRLGNSQGTGPKSQSGVWLHSETAFPVVHPWNCFQWNNDAPLGQRAIFVAFAQKRKRCSSHISQLLSWG